MLIKELIEKLTSFPQETQVMFGECSGCSECNPEAFDMYHDIDTIEYIKERHYPNREINIVLIS